MKRLLYFLREQNYVTVKNTPRLFFYHISLLITHFNEWNTPQTEKLSGALSYIGTDLVNLKIKWSLSNTILIVKPNA